MTFQRLEFGIAVTSPLPPFCNRFGPLLIVVALNWSLVLGGRLQLIFAEFDKPRVLVVLIVTAVLSVFGWWLFRTIFKTVRQFRSGRYRGIKRRGRCLRNCAWRVEKREVQTMTSQSDTARSTASRPS